MIAKAARGALATGARKALDRIGTPNPSEPPFNDWASFGQLGVGGDELSHRRFVFEGVVDMAKRVRAGRGPDDRAPLPADYAALALVRLVGNGPLQAWFVPSPTSSERQFIDDDPRRVLDGWDAAGLIAGDGCIDVDVDIESFARGLITTGLQALGVSAKRAADGFAKKAIGGKKASERVRR